MAARLHRTQVLLEPEQHDALRELAAREGRSVSELIRDLLREQLAARRLAEDADVQQHLSAVDRIRGHRRDILARRNGQPIDIDVTELVQQVRNERDEEIVTGGRPDRR